ncbi:methylglyoxal synthase [Fluviispira multicolorata]|uniref:Methylglyoxal synthase n=1 Tax=Fluviispira multicolorata TaxID=2654512 RepID=A0A833N6T5_9BACT|nr:methylglyoxal synthase [Fluviispira multicolorata]KAB8030893.1 methylglyoxal synthase [Fluviispira multicolorata]
MHSHFKEVNLPERKKIVLIAHDNKKRELLEWAVKYRDELSKHKLFATGTTGKLLERETGLKVTCFESGPLGGDMQAGAYIADGKLDLVLFFWDPLAAQPHDPDVRALLRVAVVWNVPLACNRSSADFLISSPYFSGKYTKKVTDFTVYKNRKNS